MTACLCRSIHSIAALYLSSASCIDTIRESGGGTKDSDFIFCNSASINSACDGTMRDSHGTFFAVASPEEYATLPAITNLSVAAVISQGWADQAVAVSAISFLS